MERKHSWMEFKVSISPVWATILIGCFLQEGIHWSTCGPQTWLLDHSNYHTLAQVLLLVFCSSKLVFPIVFTLTSNSWRAALDRDRPLNVLQCSRTVLVCSVTPSGNYPRQATMVETPQSCETPMHFLVPRTLPVCYTLETMTSIDEVLASFTREHSGFSCMVGQRRIAFQLPTLDISCTTFILFLWSINIARIYFLYGQWYF